MSSLKTCNTWTLLQFCLLQVINLNRWCFSLQCSNSQTGRNWSFVCRVDWTRQSTRTHEIITRRPAMTFLFGPTKLQTSWRSYYATIRREAQNFVITGGDTTSYSFHCWAVHILFSPHLHAIKQRKYTDIESHVLPRNSIQRMTVRKTWRSTSINDWHAQIMSRLWSCAGIYFLVFDYSQEIYDNSFCRADRRRDLLNSTLINYDRLQLMKRYGSTMVAADSSRQQCIHLDREGLVWDTCGTSVYYWFFFLTQ